MATWPHAEDFFACGVKLRIALVSCGNTIAVFIWVALYHAADHIFLVFNPNLILSSPSFLST